ncbi:hypothetical protein [Plesiomonas shigelloides]|uniref:hypothetical protein n=1 Tax=Plesiomonas shigelloides TaxID=703 RepID=UPI003EBE808A
MTELNLDSVADELLIVIRKHLGDEADINILVMENTPNHMRLKVEAQGREVFNIALKGE